MDTLPESPGMHNHPPSDPREQPVADVDTTRAERQHALAQTLRERADVVQQCGEGVLRTMTGPSYHELRDEERRKQERIAEAIAEVRFGLPLDQIPEADQKECRYSAMYCLRRPHQSWRIFAGQCGEHAIDAGLSAELTWFSSQKPKVKRRVCRVLRQCAFAAFSGVLEDCGGVITPGIFLRCHAGTLDGEGK